MDVTLFEIEEFNNYLESLIFTGDFNNKTLKELNRIDEFINKLPEGFLKNLFSRKINEIWG